MWQRSERSGRREGDDRFRSGLGDPVPVAPRGAAHECAFFNGQNFFDGH